MIEILKNNHFINSFFFLKGGALLGYITIYIFINVCLVKNGFNIYICKYIFETFIGITVLIYSWTYIYIYITSRNIANEW